MATSAVATTASPRHAAGRAFPPRTWNSGSIPRARAARHNSEASRSINSNSKCGAAASNPGRLRAYSPIPTQGEISPQIH
jgi:hypothetical protein